MHVPRKLWAGTMAGVLALGIAGLSTVDTVPTRADEPAVPEVTREPLPSAGAYAASVAASTSPEQAAAMADGVVTLEEYEAAIQRYFACVSAHGVTPDPDPARGLRPSTFRFIVPDADGVPDKETVEYYRTRMDACRMSHVEHVNIAWALQQAVTPQATIDESLRLVEACLSAAGIERTFVTFGALVNALHNGFDAADPADQHFNLVYSRDCRLQVEEATGFQLP